MEKEKDYYGLYNKDLIHLIEVIAKYAEERELDPIKALKQYLSKMDEKGNIHGENYILISEPALEYESKWDFIHELKILRITRRHKVTGEVEIVDIPTSQKHL